MTRWMLLAEEFKVLVPHAILREPSVDHYFHDEGRAPWKSFEGFKESWDVPPTRSYAELLDMRGASYANAVIRSGWDKPIR